MRSPLMALQRCLGALWWRSAITATHRRANDSCNPELAAARQFVHAACTHPIRYATNWLNGSRVDGNQILTSVTLSAVQFVFGHHNNSMPNLPNICIKCSVSIYNQQSTAMIVLLTFGTSAPSRCCIDVLATQHRINLYYYIGESSDCRTLQLAGRTLAMSYEFATVAVVSHPPITPRRHTKKTPIQRLSLAHMLFQCS